MIEKNKIIPEVIPLLGVLFTLFVAAVVGWLFTETSFKVLFSLMFAIFFYVILPGYCILLNFNIVGLERVIFGMPVSIAVVSIFLYVWDLLGFKLSSVNVLFVIFVICVFALLFRYKFTSVE